MVKFLPGASISMWTSTRATLYGIGEVLMETKFKEEKLIQARFDWLKSHCRKGAKCSMS